MKTNIQTRSRTIALRRASRRRLIPLVESIEQRTLLATGIGFLQGYAYVDNNGNNRFDAGDTANAGVTVQLFTSDGKKLLASTKTDANGYYHFTGLAPGNAKLVELDPQKLATGTQSSMTVDQAKQVATNAVAVTIADPAKALNIARQPGLAGAVAAFTVANGPFNGQTQGGDEVHQYQINLSGGSISGTQSIYSFCTDLFHSNPANYSVTLAAGPSAPISTYNAGRIGYLYSTYGHRLLTPTNGAGLAMAIWELEYDSSPDLGSGNFQVRTPGSGSPTDAAAYAAAQNYLADSAGKSRDAYFLNVTGVPTGTSGTQSMITTESINFANAPAPPPPPPPTSTPGLKLVKTAEQSTFTLGQSVTYDYTVTNTGDTTLTNVVVTDDNATPGYTADDFTVGTIASLAAGASQSFKATLIPAIAMSATVSSKTQVGTLVAQTLPSGDIKVTYIQSLNIVDNTYGANASAGWGTHGHKFNDLVGSDEAEFKFTDANGKTVLDFMLDYVSKSSKYPSGYGTLGATGGDGKMITGSASSILSYDTSMTDNLNNPAFVNDASVQVNSPAQPNAKWNYYDSYTMVISKGAFGSAGFGGVSVPSVHNSPSMFTVDKITAQVLANTVTNTATAVAVSGSSHLTATAKATVTLVATPPPPPPPAPAALKVVKTADDDSITAGQTAGFLVTITNTGKGTATHVTVTDALPAGVGSDINWHIDTSGTGRAAGTEPGDFLITGAVGHQVLTLSASFADTLAPGQSISVHYTGVTSTADVDKAPKLTAKLVNTAAATAVTGSTTLKASAQATIAISISSTKHGPFTGLTLGYWKNHTSAWGPTGFTTSQTLGSVFTALNTSTYSSLKNVTLLSALSFKGGSSLQAKAQILLKQAVAALLNSAHPQINYPLTTAEVVTLVDNALTSQNANTILALSTQLDSYNSLEGVSLSSPNKHKSH